MAPRVVPHVTEGTILSAFFILLLFVATSGSLFGQATPFYQQNGARSTNGNPEYSRPNKEVSLPNSTVNMAGLECQPCSSNESASRSGEGVSITRQRDCKQTRHHMADAHVPPAESGH
jgi:hypothetical protein